MLSLRSAPCGKVTALSVRNARHSLFSKIWIGQEVAGNSLLCQTNCSALRITRQNELWDTYSTMTIGKTQHSSLMTNCCVPLTHDNSSSYLDFGCITRYKKSIPSPNFTKRSFSIVGEVHRRIYLSFSLVDICWLGIVILYLTFDLL